MQLAKVDVMREGATRSGSWTETAARTEAGERRGSESSGPRVCSIAAVYRQQQASAIQRIYSFHPLRFFGSHQ